MLLLHIVHVIISRESGHFNLAFIKTLWQLEFQIILVSCKWNRTNFPSCSAPAAQTAIVHGVASLHKDPAASLYSQSHHSTPSQKAATVPVGAAEPANRPHVLSTAEVGAACRETLYCLHRNIRSAVLLAVPTHMALFFMFLGVHSGEEMVKLVKRRKQQKGRRR